MTAAPEAAWTRTLLVASRIVRPTALCRDVGRWKMERPCEDNASHRTSSYTGATLHVRANLARSECTSLLVKESLRGGPTTSNNESIHCRLFLGLGTSLGRMLHPRPQSDIADEFSIEVLVFLLSKTLATAHPLTLSSEGSLACTTSIQIPFDALRRN